MKSKKKHAKKQAKAVNNKTKNRSSKHKKSTNRFENLSDKALQGRILDQIRANQENGMSHAHLLNAMKANIKSEKRLVNEQLNELLKNKAVVYAEGKLKLLQTGNSHKAASSKNRKAKPDSAVARVKGQYEGRLDVSSRGTGFVIVEGLEQDIRVSERDLGTAFKGDKVLVALKSAKGSGNRRQGRIMEILERRRTRFVGKVLKIGSEQWMIEADSRSAHVDFFILPNDLRGAQHKDKVLFELLAWHNRKGMPQAKVIEVLGPEGSREATMLSILGEAQYRASFPDEVEAYVKELDLEIRAPEVQKRLDLRDELIFTIDPVDAKDFDDALSIQILDNGNYWLGVHIADVTHFLHKDSVLDKEALQRATSVYLVDRVIPMLPEALSNYACSLRPGEDKYAYSCFMEISPRGKLISHKIAETVIHSKRRFTYEQAQEVLDGKLEDTCKAALQQLARLAETLMKKRMREGSIRFETPEPRFILDEEGRPIDVKVKQRLFAHKLIEECMLMANKTVALYVDEIRKKVAKKGPKKEHFPFFYRVHDKPDPKKLAVMAEYVKPLGIQFDPEAELTNAKALNHILSQVEGKPIEQAVNDLMVRSMAKAEYKPENIGHFGLGFSHYAHFTSPIRRYPDVIVHRLLKAYHAKERATYNYGQLQDLGTHTSNQEKEASIAERESIKLKQVEYMSERHGQEFEGVISGFSDRGMFATMTEVYCEGMVALADLNDDYYVYHQHLQQLIGNNKGKRFKIGDPVKVKVVDTNLERRTIDLSLIIR